MRVSSRETEGFEPGNIKDPWHWCLPRAAPLPRLLGRRIAMLCMAALDIGSWETRAGTRGIIYSTSEAGEHEPGRGGSSVRTTKTVAGVLGATLGIYGVLWFQGERWLRI